MSIVQQKALQAARVDSANINGTFKKYARQNGFLAGAAYARGADSWIKVEEGLPERDPGPYGALGMSVDVLCVTDESARIIGYFDTRLEAWTNRDTGELVIITHWQPMPQLPNV